MPTLTLRGLDDEEAQRLRDEASRHGVSLNSYLLRIVRGAVGLTARPRRARHTDLDSLAGTWSEEEAQEFLTAIAETEQVDAEMWR